MDLIDRDLRDDLLDLPNAKTYVRQKWSADDYDDEQFRLCYRLTKDSFSTLLGHLTATYDAPSSTRGLPLSLELKLALFLRTLATNSFQLTVGDKYGVSQATVSRSFHDILELIFNMREEFVYWPDEDESARISRRFYTKTGIPGVVGSLDGSLIRIRRPTDKEHEYVCRKGYHAINMAAVVDDRHMFRWVTSSYPGSAADCRVSNESHLAAALDRRDISGTLLADSGYRPSATLLTPILHPRDQRESRFTEAVCKGRVCVEQAFGHLKRQWSCLHSGLRFDEKTNAKVIVVCCVLRNISNVAGDPLFDGSLDADGLDPEPNVNYDARSPFQDHIINTFF